MQSSAQRSPLPPDARRCQRWVARGLLALLLVAPPGAPPAWAGIAGEQVVTGDVSFQQEGDVTTIYASDGAIIQYDKFSVWSNEELHFVQPYSEARVLNRVLTDVTRIDGGVFANGIVYIVNPAGIFVGPNAVLDLGGLIAAGGNITNEDFLAGADRFELTGAVGNAGRIEAASVVLLGTAVANSGSIRAPDGTIALVAGEQVLLTRLGGHLHVEVEGAAGDADVPAIEQLGNVDAGAGEVSFTTGDVYSLALNHDGITRARSIDVRAASGLVQVAGLLDASDRNEGATGGSIAVTGEQVALLGAALDASGDAGGGAIRVGGDLRGQGALPTAQRSYVDAQSTLRTDAVSRGDGGRVIVWADEATSFHGAISARGGASGGDGGFAEVSGAVFLWSDGDVDLRAVQGANGTLLYDPQDIQLVGGSGDGSDMPDPLGDRLAGDADVAGQILFADVGDLAQPFQIRESELEGTNANVVLEATNSITTTGAATFTNAAAGEGVGVIRIRDGNSLTMRTRNATGDEVGSATAPGIDLTGVSLQTTGGGSVALSTGNGDIAVGGITTSGADGATGGAGGAISLLAGDSDTQGDSDVTVTGALVARGGAGTAGAGGNGGAVTIRSDGAAVDIGGTTDPIQGGGTLAVAAIDTSGGAGTTSGGVGGAVLIDAGDGAITATGTLDTSGGDGETSGANAGSITLRTRDADADMNNANDVTTQMLLAQGGNGVTGAGGFGGTIRVNTLPSFEIASAMDPGMNVQEAVGGGDISVLFADSSGGNGGTSGGSARGIILDADGVSTLGIGGARATGGDAANGNGGSGAGVTLTTHDGDLTAGAIVTAGGDGTNLEQTGRGGNGGAVTIRSGTDEDGGGDILLLGNVDAREGASGAMAQQTLSIDGGVVTIDAAGDLEHGPQAGPHVATSNSVLLTAGGSIGASSPFELQGGAEAEDNDGLTVTAGGRADVRVTNAGFLGALVVIATNAAADIDVTQTGDGETDVIDMLGSSGQMVVNRVDARDKLPVRVSLQNPDAAASDATLVLATGSVTAGGTFNAVSDGDLVIGTSDGTVITASTPDPAVPGDPVVAGTVLLKADVDGDGVGALRDAPGAATGVIDMLAGADEPGVLLIDASQGIGEAGAPIVMRGGGSVAAANHPLKNLDADTALEPDNTATSGIFLRNIGSGDLSVVDRGNVFPGAVVTAGSGDIQITNDVGDVGVAGGEVASKPFSSVDGTGGDVTFTVSGPASRIVLDTLFPLASGGVQTFVGDVALARNTAVEADGGIEILGGLDTQDTATREAAFTAIVGDATLPAVPFVVQDGIGTQRSLASFTLVAAAGVPTSVATLDLPSITTTGSQIFAADVALDQDVSLRAGNFVSFEGDVGASAASSGLEVSSPLIAFRADTSQSVTTGTSGIRLNPAGRSQVPVDATIGKFNGDLRLASSGPVRIGDGEKLSVAGRLELEGSSVRFTDLSALDIAVQSPDVQIFAREPGLVRRADGSLVRDGGTDLVANSVAFLDASPAIVGAGPAPRIATASGAARNAGALAVTRLPAPLVAGSIASGTLLLDLAIPSPDPGHETPELLEGRVVVPQDLLTSEQQADPGPPPEPSEVVAFLSCAPVGTRSARPGCAAAPDAPPGSALDTERAAEIADAYRELLGDSDPARAGRRALAAAAADPRVALDGDPAARGYLAQLGRVLAETRLLGLGEANYAAVRDELLEAVVEEIDAPALDRDRLAAAVRARAGGLPI